VALGLEPTLRRQIVANFFTDKTLETDHPPRTGSPTFSPSPRAT
jgi:hypothetical protein